MLAREPLASAINKLNTEEAGLLSTVPSILRFAEDVVGLEPDGSYTSYVPLERDYPVYTVVAAEEFSTEPHVWCYLVIGCASYRGYFSQVKAEGFANTLVAKGLEVHTQGALAYSTLGWFEDPVLPTMLRYGEVYLVELLLHELTHQRIYLDGDTRFNEALASAVAELGTELWIATNKPDLLAAYKQTLALRLDFDQLIALHKEKLETLYSQNIDKAAMREQKHELTALLKHHYEQLKASKWNGDTRYDQWFEQPVNNARLAGFSSYRELVSDFKWLYKHCERDFKTLFKRLELELQADEKGAYRVPKSCSTQ